MLETIELSERSTFHFVMLNSLELLHKRRLFTQKKWRYYIPFACHNNIIIIDLKILLQNDYQGDLHLSLSYNPISHNLTGTVSKATGLRKHDTLILENQVRIIMLLLC